MKHFIQGLIIGNTINFSIDGRMYKKTCVNEESADAFFDALIEAKEKATDEAVENLLILLNQTMRIAKENGLEYDIETGLVYLNGFSTPVPDVLVSTIEKYHDKKRDITPIMNFWKLLMINPDKRVRTAVFDFISEHDFSVTDNGYMVVYKAVEMFDKHASNDLNVYVGEMSWFVKNNWKCSPNKYGVYQDEEGSYKITKEKTLNGWDMEKKGVTYIGNLGKLNEELLKATDNSNAFLPRYCTWNKDQFDLEKEKIQLGIPQTQDRGDVDSDPSRDCSNGLHVGATKYVESFASSSSVILVCLVNPANVVVVPNYDHSKIRVSEYFPFALAQRIEGRIDIIDQPYLENDYLAYEQEELERQIEAINNDELRLGADSIDAEEDRNIDEVLKALQSRVVDITELA